MDTKDQLKDTPIDRRARQARLILCLNYGWILTALAQVGALAGAGEGKSPGL